MLLCCSRAVLCCTHTCSCGIDEETAARIAREIERGDTSNPHLAEERGQEVDDSGVRHGLQCCGCVCFVILSLCFVNELMAAV